MRAQIGKQIINRGPELATILGVTGLGVWLYSQRPSLAFVLEILFAVMALLLTVWLSLHHHTWQYQRTLQLANDANTLGTELAETTQHEGNTISDAFEYLQQIIATSDETTHNIGSL